MAKAWPDMEPDKTVKEKFDNSLNAKTEPEEAGHINDTAKLGKGSQVWPKSLVDSTVDKTLKELLNQSFDQSLSLDSEIELTDQEVNVKETKKISKKKTLRPVDLKKLEKVEPRVFAFEDTVDEEPKKKTFRKVKLDQNNNSITSDSIKYIWIALGSFCLLAFLFLNSILSKLKNLENLISRQTKVLTN